MSNSIITWEKDQRAQNITLAELEQSTAIQDFSGRFNKNAPLKHFDLIDNIVKHLGATYNVEVGNIFVAKNKTRTIPILDPKKEGLLKATIFESLIAEIFLKDFTNNENTMKIALSYNNRGITLAQGVNIEICSNMTIMNSSNMLSTEGRNGLPYDKAMELFNSWIPRMGETYETYNKIIESMKTIQMSSNGQIQELIGKLHLKAVQQAYHLGGEQAPLTINELSKFTNEIIKSKVVENSEIMSLWDIYNVGTQILTHADNNIDTKLPLLNNVSDFIIKEYMPEFENSFITLN
jgi:hypothetical protein